MLLFLAVIELLQGQLWDIIEGAAPLTQLLIIAFLNFRLQGQREPHKEVGFPVGLEPAGIFQF